jgi:hypothetical protein
MFVYLVKLGRKDGQGIGNVVAVYCEQGGAKEMAMDYNCDRERLYGKGDELHFYVECHRVKDR